MRISMFMWMSMRLRPFNLTIENGLKRAFVLYSIEMIQVIWFLRSFWEWTNWNLKRQIETSSTGNKCVQSITVIENDSQNLQSCVINSIDSKNNQDFYFQKECSIVDGYDFILSWIKMSYFQFFCQYFFKKFYVVKKNTRRSLQICRW